MMQRVDRHRLSTQYLMQHRPLLHRHGVRGFPTVGILTVLDERLFAPIAVGMPLHGLEDILIHLAVESHDQCLYASAYTQHGHLTVVSQASGKQFGLVACGVDAMQSWRGFLAGPQRVEVATSCQHQSVDLVERVDDGVLVVHRRYDDRHSPRLNHRQIIAVAKPCVAIDKIARQPDERTVFRFRITGINVVQALLNVKRLHYLLSKNTGTGTSLLMLCSSEMSVSVATTPGMPCIWLLSKSINCSLSRA